jgi:DNA-binding NarL/FixJ family response regulator
MGSPPKPENTVQPIRVFLADDHPVVLRGVKDALSHQKGILVVGEATSGKAALKKVKATRPDIVLIDISMPAMTGIEVAMRLRRAVPTVRVIAFTMHDNKEYVHEILRQGACGYILKNTSTEELVKAIKAVHRGEKYFSAEVSRTLLEEYTTQVASRESDEGILTHREKEVLGLVANGLTSKEIGAKLRVSARTVDTHRERIMMKLNIHTAVGLANYAHEKGTG